MTKDERRQAMPIVTAWIDEMRELFGPIPYISARENGVSVEWGRRTEYREEA